MAWRLMNVAQDSFDDVLVGVVGACANMPAALHRRAPGA
jgi:hypothetical protein